MIATADWRQLAVALRELHRALMERARKDYERAHRAVPSPVEWLQLLTTDPLFAWLRSLSELMVDIDLVRDAEAQDLAEISPAVRAAVEHLITPPDPLEPSGAFAQHYWPYVQDDPHVAMAHADVKRAIAPWPRPQDADAASLLQERHRLAEKARQH